MPFHEGDRFGRYIIGPLLGQGGMGAVHRAEDTLLSRAVALKILLHDSAWGPGVAPSPEAVARLLREARAAAALDHPNAVAIFDVGEEGDHAYIAMELVAGAPLRALIGDEAQPLDRRIRWSLEVARALAAAHRRGIIHRDVKPENVMIRRDGVVKVVDFGIARRAAIPAEDLRAAEDSADTPLREVPSLPTLTEKGLSVGTPLYMAPEQLRGEPLAPEVDQFAWATLTFELLTGRSPWTSRVGTSPAGASQVGTSPVSTPEAGTPEPLASPAVGSLEVLSNILTRRPARMRATHPQIPSEVDDIVQRALSKDAADRFPSMEEVVRALEPHAGVAIERRAATVPPQRVKRRRTLVATIAIVAVAMAALILVVRARRGRQEARDREASAARAKAQAEAETVPLTEHGSRLSANAMATAAYRAGTQARRDASLEAARERFREAIALDPSFAAARLGLLLAAWDVDDDLRDTFRSATVARAALGDHDRALLACLEPWVQTPPDLAGMEARLVALTEREPSNVDALYLLGKARNIALRVEESLAPLDAAIRLDPGLAEALDVRAGSLAALDRTAEALHDFARCVEISPGATSCLRDVQRLQANEGHCVEAEATARAIIKSDPDSARGYRLLAYALYGEGRPLESVRVALDEAAARSRSKEGVATQTRFQLDCLEGRFDDALAALAEWEAPIKDSQDDADHVYFLQQHVAVLFETRRPADAAALARDYVKRRAGYTPDPSELDSTLDGRRIEYQAGTLPRDAFVRERAGWLGREWARFELETNPRRRSYVWFAAYAATVKSPADAREAIAVLPKYMPLPGALERDVVMDEALGGALLRAGHATEAVAPLRRAAASCVAVEQPLIHTQAVAALGDAAAKVGDKAAACSAYRTVLARWGKARPASVTAEHARAASHALGCPAEK